MLALVLEGAACGALAATAITTAAASALFSHPKPSVRQSAKAEEFSDAETHISMSKAILFPVIASGTLISMFFLWRFVAFQYIFVVMMGIALTTSLITCIAPVVGAALGPLGCSSRLQGVTSSAVAICVLITWTFTGHWLLNNLCGVGLCAMMVRTIRLPSLRIACVTLLGLLVYDVYWVFLSHLQFGKSVMIEVAQQKAHNPVHDAAQVLPILNQLPASWLPPPKLDMPNKLMFPVYFPMLRATLNKADKEFDQGWLRFAGFIMLGLGDIALPALFIAYARNIDLKILLHQTSSNRNAASGPQFSEPPPLVYQPQALEDASSTLESRPFSIADMEVADRAAIVLDAEDEPHVTTTRFRLFSYALRLKLQIASAIMYVWRECFVLPSYLRAACWGYSVGVLVAMFVARTFHVAQPALLYIVPCTLGPVIFRAWSQGRAHRELVWSGDERALLVANNDGVLTDVDVIESLP